MNGVLSPSVYDGKTTIQRSLSLAQYLLKGWIWRIWRSGFGAAGSEGLKVYSLHLPFCTEVVVHIYPPPGGDRFNSSLWEASFLSLGNNLKIKIYFCYLNSDSKSNKGRSPFKNKEAKFRVNRYRSGKWVKVKKLYQLRRSKMRKCRKNYLFRKYTSHAKILKLHF